VKTQNEQERKIGSSIFRGSAAKKLVQLRRISHGVSQLATGSMPAFEDVCCDCNSDNTGRNQGQWNPKSA
jgi:hypothetical protein